MGKSRGHFRAKVPRGVKFRRSTGLERVEWVKARWREDINIPISGRDGMQQRVADVFGVIPRTAQLQSLQKEVRDEAARKMAPEPNFPPKLAPRLELIKGAVEKPAESEKPEAPAPGSTKSAADVAMRAEYARELIAANPSITQAVVIAAVRKRFGLGINPYALRGIRRKLEQGAPAPTAPPPQKTKVPRLRKVPKAKAPKSTKAPAPVAPPNASNTPESVRAAVQMLIEEVPDLVELHMRMVDGKPVVTFKVETVQTGSVEL